MNQTSLFSPEQEEQIKQAIRCVYQSLCADYGQIFISQFKSDRNLNGITPNAWMHRLYKRVYGCSSEQIVNGFERLTEQAAGLKMPSMDEIVKAVQMEKRKTLEINHIPKTLDEKVREIQSRITKCAFPACEKLGTVSGSTRGDDVWYCMNHFRQR